MVNDLAILHHRLVRSAADSGSSHVFPRWAQINVVRQGYTVLSRICIIPVQ